MKTIKQNVPLRNYSNYKIGGEATYFLEVTSREELILGIKEWRDISRNFSDEKKKIFVLSGGSNVLIDDRGIDGLVIHDNITTIERNGEQVTSGSGLKIEDFLNFCIANSLSGLEWAGGLPGTIGGAVRGNAGAFGGETKNSILEVRSINLETLEETTRNNKDCRFDYRTSIFKQEAFNEFILSVVFKLTLGKREDIEREVYEKINYRKVNHPLDLPSIGSTFKNIPFDKLSAEQQVEFKDFIKNDPFPVLPVAKLLHLANLKGQRVGDAQVSEKHPNFIVNLGNSTAKDVKELIVFIKKTIMEKFKVALEEEIVYFPR